MKENDAATLIAEMAATWPQREISSPEAAVWRSTLTPWPVGMARKVIADLRLVSEWLPTHAAFTARIKELEKRHGNERALPAPRVCELCGGSGWQTVDPAKNVVTRCGCANGLVTDEHKSGCSCSRCHYGNEAVNAYRSGRVPSL